MRTLIAGLGNVFEGDDGFGVEVAKALSAAALPAGAEVRDYGIRGVHLAYQLLDGYDLVVIVDAVSRGGTPGTLYVIEHLPDGSVGPPADDAPMLDAHDLAPDGVLALVPLLGGVLGRVVVVGCEPATIAPSMVLSPAVAGSVDKAVQLVHDIVRGAHAGAADTFGRSVLEARIGGW
jgi:hydrogenase maturation protease